jgi:uncharacterized cupin superfamily protein
MTRAVHVDELTTSRSNSYPEPFRSRMGERTKRRLGDAFGLTQLGVNLVEISPGAQSALRHWHTLEDEMIYVIEGELVLVTDDGEQTIGPGSVVGFRAGVEDGHHLFNRSSAPARYLELGSRIDADVAHYPDDDLTWVQVDGRWRPARKDGSVY